MNSFLFVLITAFIASTYHYRREKRLLREFIRSSRRHRSHQEMDLVRRQKANRYLSLSIVLVCITVPLLIENFIEGFIGNNWKWLLPVISISIFLRLYRNYITNRTARMTKSFAMGFENANNS